MYFAVSSMVRVISNEELIQRSSMLTSFDYAVTACIEKQEQPIIYPRCIKILKHVYLLHYTRSATFGCAILVFLFIRGGRIRRTRKNINPRGESTIRQAMLPASGRWKCYPGLKVGYYLFAHQTIFGSNFRDPVYAFDAETWYSAMTWTL